MEQKTVFHDSSADGNKFYDHHETDTGIDTILYWNPMSLVFAYQKRLNEIVNQGFIVQMKI